jgi:hypothetical protein
MAIADERKIINDHDIVAVVSSVRTSQPAAAGTVDPFDTPSTSAPHAMHESGYGHGV